MNSKQHLARETLSCGTNSCLPFDINVICSLQSFYFPAFCGSVDDAVYLMTRGITGTLYKCSSFM